MLFLAPILAATAAPLPPAQQRLTSCYISNVYRMSASNEPVSVVADTVLALCSHLEQDARSEIIEETIQNLMQDGSTQYHEAKRVVHSIEDKSYSDWRYRYRGLIQSQIIRVRQDSGQ